VLSGSKKFYARFYKSTLSKFYLLQPDTIQLQRAHSGASTLLFLNDVLRLIPSSFPELVRTCTPYSETTSPVLAHIEPIMA
jgi:hypothetical protein